MLNKSLVLPPTDTQILRLDVQALRRDHSLRTFHLREQGGALAVAEGEEKVYDVPQNASGIYSVRGRVYCYLPSDKLLCTLNESYRYRSLTEPMQLVCLTTQLEEERTYALTGDGVMRIKRGNTDCVGVYGGVTCGCVHAERLFAARGHRLYYSAPMDGDDLAQKRRKGGFYDFPSDAGDILATVSYKERLYLFRRRGITAVRFFGDALNTKSTVLAYGAGNLVKGSVAPCGDKICFFTERGFYSFNGGVVSRVEDACAEEVDTHASVKAVSAYGKYFALLRKKTGEKALFCFEPETQTGHFILHGAQDVAAGDDFWFKRDGGVYRLNDCGLPAEGECRLEAKDVAFRIGDERFIDAVAVEGEGSFEVCVRSSRGERSVSGAAQTALRLRSPLRGNGFSVTVKPLCASARFKAVFLRLRGENDGN